MPNHFVVSHMQHNLLTTSFSHWLNHILTIYKTLDSVTIPKDAILGTVDVVNHSTDRVLTNSI